MYLLECIKRRGFLRLLILCGTITRCGMTQEVQKTIDLPLGETVTNTTPIEILIDDFDQWRSEKVVYYKRKNSLGHYHGTWAKRPSHAIMSKSETHRRGRSGKGLMLTYNKTSGWCGWYTLLGELDLTEFNTLSFWVKGQLGGERFDIGFIDTQREKFEVDAVYAGPIQRFIKGEVTTNWQEVKIPLSRVAPDVDLSKMSAVIFWFRYEGTGTIYIDDMKFKVDPQLAGREEENFPRASVDAGHPRNLWIWKVDPIVNSKAAKEIFKICQYGAITKIYLYLPFFEDGIDKRYRKKLQKFLRECVKNGIAVNALNGHPTWALRGNHRKALKWLTTVLEYNQSVSKDSRFNGLVLDIEPYLVEEWTSDRDRLKLETLELLQSGRKLIDSYSDQVLTLSCPIPVFYKDEKDFVEEILKLSDYASLMDYFDSAPAILSNAEYYLDLAEKLGKKIWITTEVQDVFGMGQGSRRNTFFEEGWQSMEDELKKVATAYDDRPSFGGFEIHCYYAYRQLQRGISTPQNRLRLEVPRNEIYRVNTYQTETPITVDGNLTEWNTSTAVGFSQEQNVVYGQHTWGGPKDLSFEMYSMWDSEVLYFAFKVVDDIHIVNEIGSELWKGDHIEVWLDIDLGDDFTESVNSKDDFQLGFSPGNFGDIAPEAFVWVPTLVDHDTQKIDIAASRVEAGYTVEVAIPLGVLYNAGTVPISVTDVVYSTSMHTGKQLWYTQRKKEPTPSHFHPGYRMGISVEASDTDTLEAPQKCLISSSLNRAWGDPTTFGFLEFMESITDERHQQKVPVEQTPMESPIDMKDSSPDVVEGQGPKEAEKSPNITAGHAKDRQMQAETKRQLTFNEISETLVKLDEVPDFPEGTVQTGEEAEFARRGRTGSFKSGASRAHSSKDDGIYFDPNRDKATNAHGFAIPNEDKVSIKFEYNKKGHRKNFCGSYIVINGDLSHFKTLTFLIKGKTGKETFEIGMHDIISNRREDAVFCGSIYRYLPAGVTTDWQLVQIPLADFYGVDFTKIFSLVFHFHEPGNGVFWVDGIRLSKFDLVSKDDTIKEQGYLLLDDFDHSDLNLLGRKTTTYKKLPSHCTGKRVKVPDNDGGERSLRLRFKRDISGWCGFYSLLNQIDGEYYDLSKYQSVSFAVRGKNGGENFEIGMADKAWMVIGDSLKAGDINQYLPGGVTTDWQIVTIPLTNFGKLDLTQMGSFVINFHRRGKGVIYIDEIKFNL